MAKFRWEIDLWRKNFPTAEIVIKASSRCVKIPETIYKRHRVGGECRRHCTAHNQIWKPGIASFNNGRRAVATFY